MQNEFRFEGEVLNLALDQREELSPSMLVEAIEEIRYNEVLRCGRSKRLWEPSSPWESLGRHIDFLTKPEQLPGPSPNPR